MFWKKLFLLKKICNSIIPLEKAFDNTISKLQKQPSKDVLKIYSKFTGEHPWQSVILITLVHGSPPVNFLPIFRTSFLKDTSGQLLIKVIQTIFKQYQHFMNYVKSWKVFFYQYTSIYLCFPVFINNDLASILQPYSLVYSEPCQTSKMESFARIIMRKNSVRWKPIIF